MGCSSFFLINSLAGQWPWLDATMRALSTANTYLLTSLLALAIWVGKQCRRAVTQNVLLAVLIVAADLIGAQIKDEIERPRPCRVLPQAQTVMGCG